MAMTLPEAAMYFDYCSEHPPVSRMIAGYLGVKPKSRKPQDMGDLLAMFGGPGKIQAGGPGRMPPGGRPK